MLTINKKITYFKGTHYCLFFIYYMVKHIYGHTDSKSMDQLDEIASPTRGRLNRKYLYFPVPVRA